MQCCKYDGLHDTTRSLQLIVQPCHANVHVMHCVSQAARRQRSYQCNLLCYCLSQLQFVCSLMMLWFLLSCSMIAHLCCVSSSAISRLSNNSSAVSCAAHSQSAISESSCTHSDPLQCVGPALTCQLSCHLTAALQTVRVGCSWSAELQCSASLP